jgi:hypothetical protein
MVFACRREDILLYLIATVDLAFLAAGIFFRKTESYRLLPGLRLGSRLQLNDNRSCRQRANANREEHRLTANCE